MDFYPRPGQCTGAAIDASAVSIDTDYDRDFNGTSRGAFSYRGAYAGQGTNPGWPLGDGVKTTPVASDGGVAADGGPGVDGGGGPPPADSGCSCRAAPAPARALPWLALVALAALRGAARRSRRRR